MKKLLKKIWFWLPYCHKSEENIELLKEVILSKKISQELIIHLQKLSINLILIFDHWLAWVIKTLISVPVKIQGAKTCWFKHWKAHDPFKKVAFKIYEEKLGARGKIILQNWSLLPSYVYKAILKAGKN